MSFDATADARDIDAATSIDAASLTCEVDDFSTLDMARWDVYQMGPMLTLDSGQLLVTLPMSMNGYAGLDTTKTFDFTGGTTQLEVPEVVGATNAENYMIVFLNNQNFYAIGYDGGRMHYYRREAGVDTASTEAYSSTAHRFWRLGHATATNEIYFSTSPDATTWNEHYRLPVTVPITAVKFELAAGSYAGGSAAPGQARLDNYQLCLP
jgi:hypothetical protein